MSEIENSQTETAATDVLRAYPTEATFEDSGYLQACLRLFKQACRASILQPVCWEGLPTGPFTIFAIVLAFLLYSIVGGRLAIDGAARFYWPAIADGWLSFAIWAWVCFSLRRVPVQHIQAGRFVPAPDASHLFVLSMAQGLILNVALNVPLIVAVRSLWLQQTQLSVMMQWVLYLAPTGLALSIQSVFLWLVSDRRHSTMLVALVMIFFSMGVQMATRPAQFWYPDEAQATANADADAEERGVEITQEIFETQQALLNSKLEQIQPQRPGVVDLYSLSFAPYGEENVFLNETSMVSKVMEQRFDAAGRSLQLANNPGTMSTLPWATPLNMQRAIAHMAKRMDVNEDILFIHMSSHGASDGQLSAGMWALTVKPVTPGDLKRWLDEAGIKHRVISISACFAGNWVAPLSNPDSLVMTASDADHTSYGCGRKSDLTFFGRAMYDEQLRTQTLSFETAHANARPIIKQREEEAGKSDGYSNPQISVGANIKTRLEQLEQSLQARQKAGKP